MNQIINNIYARLSSKLTAFIVIVSLITLSACDSKPAKVIVIIVNIEAPQEQVYDTYSSPDGYGTPETDIPEYEYD
jgi:hypothetical protein